MNSQDALLNDIHKDLYGRSSTTHTTSQYQDETFAKRILLTGGAGFIGSVLVRKLVLNYPEYFVLVIDKLDYCSSLNNLHPFLSTQEWTALRTGAFFSATTTGTGRDQNAIRTERPYSNFKFLHGDITDLDTVQSAMIEYRIDTVIHLAAQTHVDKSFGESIEFTRNNVLGAHVMLEAARTMFCQPTSSLYSGSQHQNDVSNGQAKESTKRFIYVSTDEVYGQVSLGQPDSKEDASLAPSNPYSATKAAAECMVQAYHKSFQLPVIITRSNNVYGPFQYPEKIFPKFIMSLLNSARNESDSHHKSHLGNNLTPKTALKDINRDIRRRSISGGGYCFIHGSGQHSRTYLYVTDVADALDVILHRGEVGEVYNIGGGHEMSNLELAQDLIHRMVVLPAAPSAACNGSTSSTKTPENELPRRSCGHQHTFSGSRQEEAEQHLSQCRTCVERIVFVEDRAFNDRRYAVDATKLFRLGWSPKVVFEDGISKTIEWYREHGKTWWGDIHRALYPHSIRMSAEDSTATSAAPSPQPSQPGSPRPG
ncbi:hypothetical protein BC939DRAFT_443852 [Gamsiella multidivaricata]|uniref:uncharacterized protein n=1 Tax=Gamsiella multidivaricata TaxID=101098 RepID=UPI00221EB335|nr:uncharacterized protein BC939DRAFT_443852 [Gamsiella multidivaricata]KAG0371060.1 hypothetical protein BGZ54_000978 [Gamsiella multidivaricata]KAI7828193.1 hypothetical protein BC939DRAFT_443852 [Gamsiella multidivaricata]